ncbi:MAG TPA: BamA/TamA family outer membrane protein, partial [Thermoanaerobaculia bacterium]|nr:BamA/TamA family outer membrane protein [Thermoanaerobaculia bacterium]
DPLSRWTRLSLRRAVQLSRGDPVPAAATFDLEVDLAQALRVRGYPDARVTVTPEPLEKRPKGPERVDLRVQVEAGPRVEFEFAGQAPPRAVRASITGLYRTDFYEEPSREDVRQQAVRVFRSLGYPAPQVTVEVRREEPTGTEVPPARTVVIRSAPGRRLKLETVAFEGIAPDAAQALLARRFGSRLARVETAEAVPQADRRLLDDLKSLGYPEARIAGRELAPDGSRLTVRIEPGVRQTIATVSVAGMAGMEGVEGEERRRLEQLLPVRPGDPFRTDRLNDAAFYLEESLLGRGFPDAEVVASHHASKDSAGPGGIDVTFQVTPGESYQLQAVDFEGQRWARESGLRRTAGLETGTPLSQAKLNEARGRLFQTGLFTRILPDVQRDPDGQARVAFSLQERARFRLAYGVRWHSEDSASAVVDLVDQNVLGRALTLGLRTLYEPDDRSGRLFLRTGGLLGTRISLESYGELREIRTEDDFGGVLLEERAEAALQLSRPFGEDTTGRVYLRRLENRVREEEPDPFFPLDVKLENTYLGVQSIYDGRNDALDPTAGTFASLDLSGSGAFLGSDFEYARLFGQLNLYRRVTTWKGRPIVWAQSTRLGLARAFGGQELLRDVRFFAGGEYSVRGYETETLGPEEVLGSFRRPAGGEALVVINEELRFPLLADVSGLLFLDLGQIWTDAGDVDTDLAKSLGLGLRARTPVGLLRGDVAFPLDRREGDPGYRFYIGLGNAF